MSEDAKRITAAVLSVLKKGGDNLAIDQAVHGALAATDDNTVLDSYADENQRLSDRILELEAALAAPPDGTQGALALYLNEVQPVDGRVQINISLDEMKGLRRLAATPAVEMTHDPAPEPCSDLSISDLIEWLDNPQWTNGSLSSDAENHMSSAARLIEKLLGVTATPALEDSYPVPRYVEPANACDDRSTIEAKSQAATPAVGGERKALENCLGCVTAAESEGLHETIEELRGFSDQTDRLIDLVERRLLWVRNYAEAGIAAPPASQLRGRAHKVMTPEEYASTPIIGWHEVCEDVDGFGGIGIRYISASPPEQPAARKSIDEIAREITAECKAEMLVRDRLANNGRNPANKNEGIRVGSDLYLMELLIRSIDTLRAASPEQPLRGREIPDGATHMRRPEYITAWLCADSERVPDWVDGIYPGHRVPQNRYGKYALAIDGEFWRWVDAEKFNEMYVSAASPPQQPDPFVLHETVHDGKVIQTVLMPGSGASELVREKPEQGVAAPLLAEAWKRYPQIGGTHRQAFIEGATWAAAHQSDPVLYASRLHGERLPSSDAAGAGSDTVKMYADTINAKNARIAELEAALGKAVLTAPITEREIIPVPLWAVEDLLKYLRRMKAGQTSIYPLGLENLLQALMAALSPTAPDQETR